MTTASSFSTTGRKRKPLLVAPPKIHESGEGEEERYKPIEWPLVRRLLGVLAPYKKQYLWGLLLGLIHVSCDLASPRFMQHIIDYVTNFVARTLPVMPTKGDAKWHIAWVVLAWGAVCVVSFLMQ